MRGSSLGLKRLCHFYFLSWNTLRAKHIQGGACEGLGGTSCAHECGTNFKEVDGEDFQSEGDDSQQNLVLLLNIKQCFSISLV